MKLSCVTCWNIQRWSFRLTLKNVTKLLHFGRKQASIYVFQMLFNKYVEKSNLKAYFEMDIRKNPVILVSFMKIMNIQLYDWGDYHE